MDSFSQSQQCEELGYDPTDYAEYLVWEGEVLGKEFRLWYLANCGENEFYVEVKKDKDWTHWDCASAQVVAEHLIKPYLQEEDQC